MNQNMQQLLQTCPYKVHLIVKDAKTDDTFYRLLVDEVFSSASLIKVPILLAVLDHMERHGLSLDEVIPIQSENRVDFSVITEQQLHECTLYELVGWMIMTSDNTATNVLIDYLGMDALNTYFRKIGLTQTLLQRKMMDFARLESGFDNVTTARDMAYLFTRIYRQDLLSEPFSTVAIDMLSRQRVHDSLKRYLLEDIQIAHKTGSLDTVEHDAGIVFNPVNDYIIGVFITEVTNNDEARQFIGRLSKAVYEQLVLQKGALQ